MYLKTVNVTKAPPSLALDAWAGYSEEEKKGEKVNSAFEREQGDTRQSDTKDTIFLEGDQRGHDRQRTV